MNINNNTVKLTCGVNVLDFYLHQNIRRKKLMYSLSDEHLYLLPYLFYARLVIIDENKQ